MATQLQLRRGTTTEHSTFVGAVGEVTVDTTKDTLVVHDGATTAGFPLAKESTVTALDSAAVHKTGDETIAGTKTLSSNPILSSGTANGVAYLNGSKVLTTGSALTFDGTNLSLTSGGRIRNIPATTTANALYQSSNDGGGFYTGIEDSTGSLFTGSAYAGLVWHTGNRPITFGVNNTEQMRLTSTGLGIGTSSPSYKLDVSGSTGNGVRYTGGGIGTIIGCSSSEGQTGTVTAHPLAFVTGATEKMRLDTSGNLGLGVTPVANTRVYVRTAAQTDTAYYADNGVNTGFKVKFDANTTFILNDFNAPLVFGTNNTERMRIDASGNVGIGTSSPVATLSLFDVTSSSNGISLQADGWPYYSRIGMVGASGGDVYWTGNWNPTGTYDSALFGTTYINNSPYYGAIIFGTGGTASSPSERMRIDSSGNLLVGTTNAFASSARVHISVVPGGVQDAIKIRPTTNSTYYPAVFDNSSGATIGYIQATTTSTTYATSSDYRLKENIQPMQNALGVVAQLNPVTYTWKADGSDGQGFIAHELQAVVPDCVTGEKDAVDAEGNPVYQGIDTSFLVATLTKAIQELKAEVDSLKSQLENK